MRRFPWALLALVAACEGGPVVATALPPDPPPVDGVSLVEADEVDLLFVIDDGPGMATVQGRVAAAMPALVDAMGGVDGQLSLRVGFTTADSGNPQCDIATADGGRLRLGACLDPGTAFSNPDEPGDACAACPSATWEITPTPTRLDVVPRPRPWIELGRGWSNVDGLDPRNALSCAAPQGTAGCRFAAPLDAARAALARAREPEDPAFGFLRDGAPLGLVWVTSGVECSVAPPGEPVFLDLDEGGDPRLWSDASAPSPTPAACWNAGVACDGASCSAVDRAPDGALVDGQSAALEPVGKAVDALAQLATYKAKFAGQPDVIAMAIGGVDPSGQSRIALAEDPDEQREYGIGPGCVDADAAFDPRPPVRVAEVVEAAAVEDLAPLWSACAADFTPAMEAMAAALRARLRPSCFTACARDIDAHAPGLQPECTLIQETPEDGSIRREAIVECQPDGSLPDDSDVCHVVRTGAARSEQCIAEGLNLEFAIVRRLGVPKPEGSFIAPRCELSTDRARDCPDMH